MAGKKTHKGSSQSNSPQISGSITSRHGGRGGGAALSTSLSHGGTSTSHEDQYEMLRGPWPQARGNAPIFETPTTEEETNQEIKEVDTCGEGVASTSGASTRSTRRGKGPSTGKSLDPEPEKKWHVKYNSKGKVIDKEGKKLHHREKIHALHQAQVSDSSSTLEPILAQVMRESKGKYVRGVRKHHKRKDVTTSARWHRNQMVNALLERNEMLEKHIAMQATHIAELDTWLNYTKEILPKLCAHLNIPMPQQPPLNPEDHRSAANEEEGESRPGSSSRR